MRSQVLNALRDESSLSSKARVFEVDCLKKLDNNWLVYVDLDRSLDRLDESLEGAMAWWAAEPRNGAAEVLCVVPEEQNLTLRFSTRKPPEKGGKIHIYPPRFLEALVEIWERQEYAEAAENWFESVPDDDEFKAECVPDMGHFVGKLRAGQKRAFELFGRGCGFLWGPPGTGKTFTIGIMLAQFLLECPDVRVLLLSTTNAATDQVLVSVDKALEDVRTGKATALRHKCKRIGQRFLAKYYSGRNHLLPVQDHSLVIELAHLQAACPPKTKTVAFAKWKEEEDALREKIRRQAMGALDLASLAAMTTTRAAFGFSELKRRAPFDLLVIDEASQVSTVHAITLAQLAECVIFAGDPRQLAPIVQSQQENTMRWLGSSMFDQVKESSPGRYMLTEQSRMTPEICELVSTCFYDRKLVVAKRELLNADWQAERKLPEVLGVPQLPIMRQCVLGDGVFSRKYGGPIRYTSAEMIRNTVALLGSSNSANEILILTPFRAQRALIRMMLQKDKLPEVPVRTVHSSQGMEFHTVLFDPTDCNNRLLTDDEGRLLVNVALSRAKARLILFFSEGDLRNPLFEQIWRTAELITSRMLPRSIDDLRQMTGYPIVAVGHTVITAKGRRLKVIRIDHSARELQLQCPATGKTIRCPIWPKRS